MLCRAATDNLKSNPVFPMATMAFSKTIPPQPIVRYWIVVLSVIARRLIANLFVHHSHHPHLRPARSIFLPAPI
jgi:hypothetical protein